MNDPGRLDFEGDHELYANSEFLKEFYHFGIVDNSAKSANN